MSKPLRKNFTFFHLNMKNLPLVGLGICDAPFFPSDDCNKKVLPQLQQGKHPITIQCLDRKSITLRVNFDFTIKHLKLLIEEHDKIPIAQQDLFFSQQRLNDDSTLLLYSIKENSTINLVITDATLS